MAEKKGTSRAPSIVSLIPFGLGETKPHHYRDMLRVLWDNRDNLGYAHRILVHGVCDGCSLGPAGLHDNTIPGIHLCMSRLKLLRLNTMLAIQEEQLSDLSRLRAMTSRELRRLGRLPYPMVYRKGEAGFRRISWEEALRLTGSALKSADPKRVAFTRLRAA